jgi:hypothetical protein
MEIPMPSQTTLPDATALIDRLAAEMAQRHAMTAFVPGKREDVLQAAFDACRSVLAVNYDGMDGAMQVFTRTSLPEFWRARRAQKLLYARQNRHANRVFFNRLEAGYEPFLEEAARCRRIEKQLADERYISTVAASWIKQTATSRRAS